MVNNSVYQALTGSQVQSHGIKLKIMSTFENILKDYVR